MGWNGDWTLKYTGVDAKKFEAIAKIVIPNYLERFEFDASTGTLDCRRSLRWYSADKDIEKICSYLGEGDRIQVVIDGETKPLNEFGLSLSREELGEYYDQERYDEIEDENERQSYTKTKKGVEVQTPSVDQDRYKSDEFGMKDWFADSLNTRYQFEPFSNITDNYFGVVAPAVKGDKELTEIARQFLIETTNGVELHIDQEPENYYQIHKERIDKNREMYKQNQIAMDKFRSELADPKAFSKLVDEYVKDVTKEPVKNLDK